MSPGRRPRPGTRPNTSSTTPSATATRPSTMRSRPRSITGGWTAASFKQACLTTGRAGRRRLAEMHVGLGGDAAAARLARDEADLQQIRLDQLAQRLGIVVDGRGQGLDADRTAAVHLHDGA